MSETCRWFQALRVSFGLSVPCVRVECLQRSISGGVDGSTTLSVPCVRVECLQLPTFHDFAISSESFSTLCSGRVSATLLETLDAFTPAYFQYPVFGSSVCNKVSLTQAHRLDLLSVPCVRVECLQLERVAEAARVDATFSTLCSGRVSATA